MIGDSDLRERLERAEAECARLQAEAQTLKDTADRGKFAAELQAELAQKITPAAAAQAACLLAREASRDSDGRLRILQRGSTIEGVVDDFLNRDGAFLLTTASHERPAAEQQPKFGDVARARRDEVYYKSWMETDAAGCAAALQAALDANVAALRASGIR